MSNKSAIIPGNTKVETSTSETLVIAAADTASRKHKVKSVNLVFSGTITIKFQDGSTDLTGAMEFTNGGSLVLGPEQCGGLQTSANAALNLVVARTSGSVRGNVEYVTGF